MPARLRLTLLVDQAASRADLEVEHGLSFLVEADDTVLLFDAGASGAAFRNAERLGLPWRRISRIVLSHGHRDHTGGLGPFLRALPAADVILHPRAFSPRYSLHSGKPPRELGMPPEVQALLQARMDQLHWATAPMRLGPWIGLTGPVPRRRPAEALSGPFFLDPEGRAPDPLEDDLALWIGMQAGLVVILGCAHAGLGNTLDQVGAVAGGKPLRAVVGGFHLSSASAARIRDAVRVLREAEVPCIAPAHCTGAMASEAFASAFGARVEVLQAGDSLVLA